MEQIVAYLGEYFAQANTKSLSDRRRAIFDTIEDYFADGEEFSKVGMADAQAISQQLLEDHDLEVPSESIQSVMYQYVYGWRWLRDPDFRASVIPSFVKGESHQRRSLAKFFWKKSIYSLEQLREFGEQSQEKEIEVSAPVSKDTSSLNMNLEERLTDFMKAATDFLADIVKEMTYQQRRTKSLEEAHAALKNTTNSLSQEVEQLREQISDAKSKDFGAIIDQFPELKALASTDR